jgi:cytoskeletal protein CcmA (bactofilin family)
MADNQDFSTIIGPDAQFKGDLTFESAAKIMGKFEGSISSKGRVVVSDGSTVRASIAAKEVAVEGHIDGNVEAGDRIELKPTGSVAGDITAARMTMAEGASINGHCKIGPQKAKTTAETKPQVVTKGAGTPAKS